MYLDSCPIPFPAKVGEPVSFTYHDKPRFGFVEGFKESCVTLEHRDEEGGKSYKSYRYDKIEW